MSAVAYVTWHVVGAHSSNSGTVRASDLIKSRTVDTYTIDMKAVRGSFGPYSNAIEIRTP
jgi:hypothetical protein